MDFKQIVFLLIFFAQNINAAVQIGVLGEKKLHNGRPKYHYHAFVIAGEYAYFYLAGPTLEGEFNVIEGRELQTHEDSKIYLKSVLEELENKILSLKVQVQEHEIQKSRNQIQIISLKGQIQELENQKSREQKLIDKKVFLKNIDVKEPLNSQELAIDVLKGMGKYNNLYNNCIDFTFEFVRRMNGGELLAKWPRFLISLHSQRIANGGYSRLFGDDVPKDKQKIYQYKMEKLMNPKDEVKNIKVGIIEEKLPSSETIKNEYHSFVMVGEKAYIFMAGQKHEGELEVKDWPKLKEQKDTKIFMETIEVKEPANPQELAEDVLKSIGKYDPLNNNSTDFTVEFVRRINGGKMFAKWPGLFIEQNSLRIAKGGHSKLFGDAIPKNDQKIQQFKMELRILMAINAQTDNEFDRSIGRNDNFE